MPSWRTKARVCDSGPRSRPVELLGREFDHRPGGAVQGGRAAEQGRHAVLSLFRVRSPAKAGSGSRPTVQPTLPETQTNPAELAALSDVRRFLLLRGFAHEIGI